MTDTKPDIPEEVVERAREGVETVIEFARCPTNAKHFAFQILQYALSGYTLVKDDGEQVTVPREPSEEMLIAGAARLRDFYSEDPPFCRTKAIYRAMIAATEEGKEC